MKILIPIVFAAQWLQGCTQPVDELPGAGQWRVINYWAIWCAPCREEIPELNALNDSTELMVFAVNYDGQNGEALQSQAAEMGITFTLLEQDPGAALGIQRPRVLPTTFLVNPEGPRVYWSPRPPGQPVALSAVRAVAQHPVRRPGPARAG